MRLLALILLLMQAPQSQQSPAPASLEGFVVKAGTSQPVVRARVVLTPAEGRAGSQATATTDGGGRFAFRNVSPGRYRLFASRDGYVRMEYGQRGLNRIGMPLPLTPGQEMKDVVLALTPTGAIAGRVHDRYGDPVVNATVQTLKNTYLDGRRILGTIQSARTNDLGEYRIYWLQPGQHYVRVIPPDNIRNDGNGVLVDVGPGSPVRFNGGNPGGAVRIGANVASSLGLVSAADTGESYLPVYFPGTTDPASAAPIDLRPGTNFTGVDLTLVETRAVRIRGQITNGVTGQPAGGASVMLVSRVGTNTTPNVAGVAPNGTFEFRGVVPGTYDAVARLNNGQLSAHIPIEVGNVDVENLSLLLQPGFNLTGTIAVEGLGSNEDSASLANIRVELRSVPFIPLIAGSNNGTVQNGSFTLSGLTAGDYQLRVTGGNPSHYVKSARLGAIDVLNSGLRIDGPPQGPLQIVISPNSGTFDGLVLDEKGDPAANVMFVLVPEPSRRHLSELYRAASADAAGRVHLQGVIPGSYKAFAWDGDVENGAWQDPDFIRNYEDRGRAVRIEEKGTATLKVPVTKVGNGVF